MPKNLPPRNIIMLYIHLRLPWATWDCRPPLPWPWNDHSTIDATLPSDSLEGHPIYHFCFSVDRVIVFNSPIHVQYSNKLLSIDKLLHIKKKVLPMEDCRMLTMTFSRLITHLTIYKQLAVLTFCPEFFFLFRPNVCLFLQYLLCVCTIRVRLVSRHLSIPINALSPFLQTRTHEETAHVETMSQAELWHSTLQPDLKPWCSHLLVREPWAGLSTSLSKPFLCLKTG